jgi:M6 family metalloprotease-like protein
MAGRSFPISGQIATGCLAFDEPSNTLWFATEAGEIRTLRLMDGREVLAGSGYRSPVGLVLDANGLGLIVVEAAGLVWDAARRDANRTSALQKANLGDAIASSAPMPNATEIAILTAAGQLVALNKQNGTVKPLVGGFSQPLGLCFDAASKALVVLQGGVPNRSIVVVNTDHLNAGQPINVPGDTSAVLAAALNGAPAALISDGAGQLTLVDLGGGPTASGPALAKAALGLARWQSLVLAVLSNSVEAIEWGLDPGTLPISMPIAPLFINGYARVEVDLRSRGLARTDVEFVVDEGPGAGFVSAGIEPDASNNAVRIVVGAGLHPGEYHLSAKLIAGGSTIGRARFRVTAHWPDEEVGPPVAVTGKQQIFVRGSWGGGQTGAQNINVLAAPNSWNVLLVLVDLKDSRYDDAAAPGVRALWTSHLTGPGPCVKQFYEEMSLFKTAGPLQPHGTTIVEATNGAIGPVHLDLGWGDAFEPNASQDVWRGWNPKDTAWQACATALSDFLADNGQGTTILPRSDAVVFIVKTASDDGVEIGTKKLPAEFAWPQASAASFFWKTATSTAFTNKPMILINDVMPSSMPADKALPSMTVLCHELGHTLGLEDLYQRGDYPAEVDARAIGELDYMGSEFTLPQASIANKMRLGWIDPSWIETFDFGKNPTGHAVTLHAVEALARSGPPAGRKAAIEVRIADGWNYYFEHRRTQGGEMTDQQLKTTAGGAQVVLGTDVRADGAAKPARPVILRLAVDANGKGPLLKVSGEDYEETDVTNPQRQHDFRLVFDQFDAADANAAHVHVDYIAAHRPELQINPAPGRGDWKSPDIDLQGPGGQNKIVKGRTHQIVVRVHNAGSLAAKNVRVGLAWLPFTTSPGDWGVLPDPQKQDIPGLSTVTFTQDWNVPAELKVDDIEVEHFCVKASVDAYVDPSDPSNSEIVIFNNWAQSNFDTATVGESSPSERRWTGVGVTNTLPDRSTYLTLAEQDNDYFRIYVGNAWVRLPAGQTRMVEVGYESLAGDAQKAGDFERIYGRGMEAPNKVSFNSFVVRENPTHCSSRELIWGAGLHLRTGHMTWVADMAMTGEAFRGHIRGRHNGSEQAVTSGTVNVVLWVASRPGNEVTVQGRFDASGRFTATVPGVILQQVRREPIMAEVIYQGTAVWAPCRSGERRVA